MFNTNFPRWLSRFVFDASCDNPVIFSKHPDRKYLFISQEHFMYICVFKHWLQPNSLRKYIFSERKISFDSHSFRIMEYWKNEILRINFREKYDSLLASNFYLKSSLRLKWAAQKPPLNMYWVKKKSRYLSNYLIRLYKVYQIY